MDEPKPLQFRHVTNYEKDRISEVAREPSKPATPWRQNLPMDQDKSARLRAAIQKHSTDPALLKQFDQAAAEEGYQPPPDETIAADMRKSGLHQTKSSDYNPDLKQSFLSEEAQGRVTSEVNQVLAELRVQPGLGAAITERLAAINYPGMDEAARRSFEVTQTALLEKVSGGPEKAAENRTLAVAALKRVSHLEFGKRLAASGLMNDAFLVVSLANQERYHAAYASLRKRKQ